MLASKPKEVLNLYEWLPPYGETSVSFRMPEAHLEVDVFYDYRSEGPTQLRKKTLIFTQVCFFHGVVVSGSTDVPLGLRRSGRRRITHGIHGLGTCSTLAETLRWEQKPNPTFLFVFLGRESPAGSPRRGLPTCGRVNGWRPKRGSPIVGFVWRGDAFRDAAVFLPVGVPPGRRRGAAPAWGRCDHGRSGPGRFGCRRRSRSRPCSTNGAKTGRG